MEKSRKNENFQNSFDKVINNHMNVPETEIQIIWSDLDALYPEKMFFTIKLVRHAISLDFNSGDIFWWKSLIFGQKSRDFTEIIDFFMTLRGRSSANNLSFRTSSTIFNTYSSRAVDCARLFLRPLKINNSKVAEK